MTENQEQIITRLKAEFDRMNNVTTSCGGKLFDKSVFDENKNLANKQRYEIELSNKAILSEIDAMIIRDMATLNEELYSMGLYAERNGLILTITSLSRMKGGFRYYMDYFNYDVKTDYHVVLADKSLTNKVVGFTKIKMYLNRQEHWFANIYELSKNQVFQGKVQELYYNVTRDKV
jgi:hypothetical protein